MLTKAEIAKLSIEQRETVAKVEFRNFLKRRRLLEQARGRIPWHYHIGTMVNVAIIVGVMVYFMNRNENASPIYLIFFGSAMAVFNLVGLQIARINRRLDALLELLDLENHDSLDRPKENLRS